MKLAFSIGALEQKSGIVKVVVNIMLALSEFDHSLTLITTGITDSEIYDKLLSSNISVLNLDIEKYGRKGKYLFYASAVKRCLSTNSFDAVVVSGTEHVLFYAIGTSGMKSDGPKLFVWEHRNFSAGPKFRLEWLGKRYAIKNWAGVICITKKDAKQYLEYSKDEGKIYQIYNLTDFNTNRKMYNRESKKIISCGYLSHIKGFDMLIGVAGNVFKVHPDWTWDIYGEGVERTNLEKLIKEAKLENNVFLKGYSSSINDIYNQYAIFVLTSRAEGMGMVLIEAQKSGLPVVSFDIKCGPSDVITNDVNGFLIKPFYLEEMAERICYLIENVDTRASFSCKSELNLEEFNKTYIVNKWMQLLG